MHVFYSIMHPGCQREGFYPDFTELVHVLCHWALWRSIILLKDRFKTTTTPPYFQNQTIHFNEIIMAYAAREIICLCAHSTTSTLEQKASVVSASCICTGYIGLCNVLKIATVWKPLISVTINCRWNKNPCIINVKTCIIP